MLWYCDNDAINENSGGRGFFHTQDIFACVLAIYYSKHNFEIVGLGKSFEVKSHRDDLLSIPDFAAGVVQDLLQGHKTGDDVPGGEEKIALMKWIATPAPFLSKIVAQVIVLEDGQLGSGPVELTPVNERA